MNSGADFAAGCGTNIFQVAPAVAYLWVHPRHGDKAWPTICGWMGHGDVFAFAKNFWPLDDAGRHATGTPAVMANEVLLWAEI